MLRLERSIADEIGLKSPANSAEVKELSKTMSIEVVTKQIKENLPQE